MHRLLLSFMLVLSLLIIPTQLIAQEQITEQTCTPEQWQELQNGLTTEIATLATSETPLLVLLRIQASLDITRATCTGGQFSQETHPTGIIGPMVFGGTLYQATLDLGEGEFGSAQLTTLEGDCGSWPLLSVSGDEGTETDLWNFEGCTAIIEVNTSSDWSLSIERLG